MDMRETFICPFRIVLVDAAGGFVDQWEKSNLDFLSIEDADQYMRNHPHLIPDGFTYITRATKNISSMPSS